MTTPQEKAEQARQAAKRDREHLRAEIEQKGLPMGEPIVPKIGVYPTPNLSDPKQFVANLQNMAQNVPPGGLPDDYDAVTAGSPMGTPVQIKVPPQGAQPPQTTAAKPTRADHPVLLSLKRDLGLLSGITDLPEFDIGGHNWSMVPVDDWGFSFALALSSTMSESPTEGANNYRTALVSSAIRTIDKVPVHKVFNIDLPTDIEAQINLDPSRIPPLVRRQVIYRLFEFLLFESKADLPTKLYEVYIEKYKDADKVKSYLDAEQDKYKTFTCPKCAYQIREIPAYDEKNQMLNFYCKYHGLVMEVEQALPLS